MKQIGIIGLVAILIIFGSPLIKIKDTHQNMEYQEIGEVMLGNVNSYVNFLDTTSNVANTAINAIETILNKIKDFTGTIMDFIKGIFEHDTGQVCTENSEGGFTCGSSEGGGGGSFGGR